MGELRYTALKTARPGLRCGRGRVAGHITWKYTRPYRFEYFQIFAPVLQF